MSELSGDYKAIERKRPGRPRVDKTSRDFRVEKEPETPFEALRHLLKLTRKEWAEKIELSPCYLAGFEAGRKVPTVVLAKRMIEEARLLGVAVTLDELYQHLASYAKVSGQEIVENKAGDRWKQRHDAERKLWEGESK